MTALTPKTGVPAIWAAFKSTKIKINDNYFYDCRFSAVFLLCQYSEISHNTMEHIGESAIYTEWTDPASASGVTSDNLICNNIIKDVYVIDIAASGIECSANNTIITGNQVSLCGGNGIGVGAASNVTVSDNITFNNSRNLAVIAVSAGILLQNVVSAPNPDKGKNIIIANNISYDDQGVKTQKYGIFVSVAGGSTPFLRCNIEGNSGTGNTTADIFINPAVFNDKTNAVRNNSAWQDFQKDTTTVTQSAVATAVLKFLTVPAGSMLQNGGLRIKAFGTVTGTTGAKTIRLKHNNVVGFVTLSFTAAQNGSWSIDAVIMNSGATNAQNRERKGYVGTTLQDFAIDTAVVDTTVDQNITVDVILASLPDTIVCNLLLVERI